ncbi:MAG: hypothetical protein LUM44_06290 [Pyrinomonadaceae bacterium]|nr:hypothetical protein [Pyrinomonadaceae bacterium]
MKFYKVFLVISFVINTLSFNQCGSAARGRVVKSKCSHGVAMINEQLDAGINIELTIQNEGKAGFIKVKPTLSSSEGNFSRNQDVYFKENERKDLSFLIHEVTINATNLQCFGTVSPEAE